MEQKLAERPSRLSFRPATRVIDAADNGPTPQVDRNILVLSPQFAAAWDPFVLLSEDFFSTVGFDWHPHRGFQTLTLVVEGRLEHRDSAGGFGVLGPGDAQWMSAGRAALHYELAHRREPVHTLQLWLNLPPDMKMTAPSYRDLRAADAPVVRGPGVEGRVFDGSAPEYPVPFLLIDARFEPGARYEQSVPGEYAVALYLVEGAATLGGQPVAAKQAAWFEPGAPGETAIAIEADTSSHVVMYAAAPIGAPIVQYGPFVMNTREEIVQAFRDYDSGLFGEIPAGPAMQQ